MDIGEMERRRTKALEALQDGIDLLGPIVDESTGKIREPVIEVLDQAYEAGEELKEIRFDIDAPSERCTEGREDKDDWAETYNLGIDILNVICDGEPWTEEKKERVEELTNEILDRSAGHLGEDYT